MTYCTTALIAITIPLLVAAGCSRGGAITEAPNAGRAAPVSVVVPTPVAAPPSATTRTYHDAELGFTVQIPTNWEIENTKHALAYRADGAPIANIIFSSVLKSGRSFNTIVTEMNITPAFKRSVRVGPFTGTLIACGGTSAAECILIDHGNTILEIHLNVVGLVTSDASAADTLVVRSDIKKIFASFIFDARP